MSGKLAKSCHLSPVVTSSLGYPGEVRFLHCDVAIRKVLDVVIVGGRYRNALGTRRIFFLGTPYLAELHLLFLH
jgi:hypothetical protein